MKNKKVYERPRIQKENFNKIKIIRATFYPSAKTWDLFFEAWIKDYMNNKEEKE